jgi:hypothetical protein
MTHRAGKTGLSLNIKVAGDIVRRFANIRALWLAIQNDPDHTVQDVAVEFFYAIGDLLEGKGLEQLDFQVIDRKRVLQHHKEG